MREFNVVIRETLEKTVTVEADSAAQAREIAERNWKDSEYILDADHFQGVTFTVPKNRDYERQEQIMKYVFTFKEINYGRIEMEADERPDEGEILNEILNGKADYNDTDFVDFELIETTRSKPERDTAR